MRMVEEGMLIMRGGAGVKALGRVIGPFLSDNSGKIRYQLAYGVVLMVMSVLVSRLNPEDFYLFVD